MRPLSLSLALGLLLTTASLHAGLRYGGGAGSMHREGIHGGSIDAQGARFGRFGAGSVEATGPNGGTYDASGARFGRWGAGSVSAEGPNGGTYDASGVRAPGYRSGSVSATGPNGGSYSAIGTAWGGYRSGYVYTGGVYRPANIVVNTAYVAPLGVYAGWTVVTQPYYVTYPIYATYPVQVAVQVQLQRQGYYNGPIDGSVGPQTQAAIAKYQSLNGLPATGQINQALLKSLNIS